MNNISIEIKNLNKRYNNIEAVKNINFTINKGSIVGLLGPNGCGKTTTIGMMLGLIKPSSGTVFINGQNIESEEAIGQADKGESREPVHQVAENRVHHRHGDQGSYEQLSLEVGAQKEAHVVAQRFNDVVTSEDAEDIERGEASRSELAFLQPR